MATGYFALTAASLSRPEKHQFPSSFSEGPIANSHWTEWVMWPFLSQLVYPGEWNMQIGQAWGTCLGVGSGWMGHWMLGRGKTTEMEVVVPEGAVASLWVPGWKTGTSGIYRQPLLLQVPGRGWDGWGLRL